MKKKIISLLFTHHIIIYTIFFVLTGTSFVSQSVEAREKENIKSSAVDFRNQPILNWKFHTNGPLISSPVIDDNTVFFGGLDSILYAVDLTSGKINWKFITYGEIRSDVLINKDQLFLVGGDGTFYCINKNTGKLTWKWIFNKTAQFLGERRYDIADYYNSSPILYKNTIYFGSGDSRMNAINAGNGKLIWTFKSDDIIHTKPAIDNDKLFFGSFDGNVYALNSHNGNLIWKFKSVGQEYFPKGELQGSPIAFNETVFIGGRDYNLYAINMDGGYCNWNRKFPKGWALANAMKDSILYVGTSEDKFIAALDPANGKELWRTDVKYNIFGAPAFTSSMLYVGTLMGRVLGIDLKTGTIKWTFTTDGYNTNHENFFAADDTFRDKNGVIKNNVDYINAQLKWGAIFSTPAISNNMMIITSTDGTAYCLKQQG